VFEDYEAQMRAMGAVDHVDLINLVVRLFTVRPRACISPFLPNGH
jgi:hypothetical protein